MTVAGWLVWLLVCAAALQGLSIWVIIDLQRQLKEQRRAAQSIYDASRK